MKEFLTKSENFEHPNFFRVIKKILYKMFGADGCIVSSIYYVFCTYLYLIHLQPVIVVQDIRQLCLDIIVIRKKCIMNSTQELVGIYNINNTL